MPRFAIFYKGGSVELDEGETLVGRGLSCKMRFNDPSVSRQHLVLRLIGSKLEIEDLGSRHGTAVNGRSVRGKAELAPGDEIRVGTATTIEVQLLGYEADSDETAPVPAVPAGRPCRVCGTRVSLTADRCPGCGAQIIGGVARLDTQELPIEEIERGVEEHRRHLRFPARIPVIYESETLTCDALSRDLALGGVFVETDVLDDVGTACAVTLLVDAAPALRIEGEVSRVLAAASATGPPGMGVRFTRMSRESRDWLTEALLGTTPLDHSRRKP
jgi:uncharacterized protein (TIGR02266 family)